VEREVAEDVAEADLAAETAEEEAHHTAEGEVHQERGEGDHPHTKDVEALHAKRQERADRTSAAGVTLASNENVPDPDHSFVYIV